MSITLKATPELFASADAFGSPLEPEKNGFLSCQNVMVSLLKALGLLWLGVSNVKGSPQLGFDYLVQTSWVVVAAKSLM